MSIEEVMESGRSYAEALASEMTAGKVSLTARRA